MKEFQQKRQLRQFLFSKVSIVILLILILLLLKADWAVYLKEKESSDKAMRAVDTLSTLQARQKALQSDVTVLKSPQGVETQIRTNFRMAKKGEKLVVFVDDSTTTPDQSETGLSLWQKIVAFFK